MEDGERRRLVFTNLANGVPVHRIMEAFQLSERDVMADFEFVAQKWRSYRFERIMSPIPCDTIAQLQANKVEAIYALSRLNLNTLPKFSKISQLPFTVEPDGRMSEAERVMLELRTRATR